MGNVKGPVAKRTAQTRVAESLQVCPAEGADRSSGVLRNDRGGGGGSAHGGQDRGSLSPQHWRGECECVRGVECEHECECVRGVSMSV